MGNTILVRVERCRGFRTTSQGIPISAPVIALLRLGLLHALKYAISIILATILGFADDFIPFSPVASCILCLEKELVDEGESDAKCDVQEHQSLGCSLG